MYDAEFRSFAGLSFGLSGSGIKLCLRINQEKFNELSLQEQQRVILHEIGHIKRGVYRGPLCAFGPYIMAVAIAGTMIFGSSSRHRPISLGRIGMAGAAGYFAKLVSHIAFAAWARHEEFAADEYAFNADGNEEVMRSLLEKRKDLFETEDHDHSSWWSRLFDNHPSSEERIAHIQQLAQNADLPTT